jgi:SMODS and SLOG-associating 2TM effector domain 2
VTVAEKPKDLTPNEFPKIVWEAGKLAEGLEQLFACVVSEANDAIAWYNLRRKPKQYGGQILRVGALIFGAVAGLIPVLGEIYQDNGRPGIAPAWATVALGIAGLLVLLDRFWGFTNAWVRFLLAQQELSTELRNFEFDWARDKLSWSGKEPTIQQATAMLLSCKAFLMQVHTIVRRETGVWASEFQNAITMIDQTARSTDRTTQSGSIAVKVTNGNQCEGGWRLTIDGGPEVAYSGLSAVLAGVEPGERTIRVVGMVNGVEKRDEKSVAVSSGGSASIELTLA